MCGAGGHVRTCLDHSISAHQLAISLTRTFGERMTYVAMYSSFVAAYVSCRLISQQTFRPNLVQSDICVYFYIPETDRHFVFRSFDIVLLEAGNANIQLGALARLRTWLGIMEEVSVLDAATASAQIRLYADY
jgi:hypothetical protein